MVILGGADDIDVNSIRIMHENLTYGILNVKWDEPRDYNGLIVNYYVEIKSTDVSSYFTMLVFRWIKSFCVYAFQSILTFFSIFSINQFLFASRNWSIREQMDTLYMT